MVSVPAYGAKVVITGYCHGGYCYDIYKASMCAALLVHGACGISDKVGMVLGSGKASGSRTT